MWETFRQSKEFFPGLEQMIKQMKQMIKQMNKEERKKARDYKY